MNKTAEELDSRNCASESLTNALISITMKFNFIFIITVVLISYCFTWLAIQALWKHNIFSNSTRLILIVCLLNSVVHQTTMLETRITQAYRSVVYDSEPCKLLFRSSDCVFELYLYYPTGYFSTYSVFSLTFDRLISHYKSRYYHMHQYFIATSLLVLQLLLTMFSFYIVFYGVSLAGYVPMCNFRPELTVYYGAINNVRTGVMVSCIIVTMFVYYVCVKSEKQIQKCSYSPGERYSAYENVTTSQSICISIVLQFSCIMISSFGSNLLIHITSKTTVSEEVFYAIVSFLPGVTYANLCLPLVIYFKTKLTTRNRKNRIAVMTSMYGDAGEHIDRLKRSWE
ncbi:Serpentine receptor class alpha-18 [Caenorhabditis elegans]|uniref:Serpentine receptor class alpha-18 n=1 Tax=Caenorhabditis elegans TaxID=6239 RepID=SRA18_CAEEL|nr:Serpentine receptor class alpha-18 [Caenorhabditis elegans]O18689.1 RecName: Full=Serpentine receptor class alpha-18; Short=Protein sra-18 [Caenorhabditis elegans]CAB07596.1 Serpentine receptor class alpha-18 [Caenorhabditis elegans]|eukprot:NP_493214.1 Serpentine receptor class alpha-18 [Caenorhabditis elegans]